MDQDKLKKPQNLAEETWRQHLQWMDVGGKQVEENFARHLARVREDADRCEELLEQHRKVLEADKRTRSLFSEE